MKTASLIFLVCVLGLLFGGQRANADELSDAIRTAPTDGITLKSAFETVGATKFEKTSSGDNTVAQITPNEASQVGGLWSHNGESGVMNQFNRQQDTEIGLWMYFGNNDSGGEGMAFVLQNSPDGNRALSGAGESLGVWGIDKGNQSKEQIAATAIQKSWLLEFDTHVNNSSTTGNFFDGLFMINGQRHIAQAYPGDASIYSNQNSNGTNAVAVSHYPSASLDNALNGGWHHVTLTWSAAQQRMSFAYDDRNPTTNAPQQTKKKAAFQISMNSIQSGNSNSAYWGITGSTGARIKSPQLVMVDHMTTAGSMDTKAQLLNQTAKTVVNDGDAVSAGSELAYQYDFTYTPPEDGREFKPLQMSLPIPAYVAVEGARVTYADGTTPETFTKADLLRADPTKLTLQTKQSLNETRNHVTVTVLTRVQPVPVPRAASTATFSNVDYQTRLRTPNYVGKGSLDLRTINLSANNQTDFTVTGSGSAQIKFGLRNGKGFPGGYENGYPLGSAQAAAVKKTIVLNGKSYSLADFNGGALASSAVGDYQFKVPATMLHTGENTLVIQATSDDQQAEPLTFTLNRLAGELRFTTVPSQESFETSALTGQSQLLSRSSPWQLGVSDDRGKGSQWQLSVALTKPFTSALAGPLAGHPVFVDESVHPLNLNEPVQVMNTTTTSDSEVTDVKWAADKGILLSVAGSALMGDYTGDLTWTLGNTP